MKKKIIIIIAMEMNKVLLHLREWVPYQSSYIYTKEAENGFENF